MQITNSVVCGRSKGCIYKQIKPPLVVEYAFPLTGFVCMEVHVTFGGSGWITDEITIHSEPCLFNGKTILTEQNKKFIVHVIFPKQL